MAISLTPIKLLDSDLHFYSALSYNAEDVIYRYNRYNLFDVLLYIGRYAVRSRRGTDGKARQAVRAEWQRRTAPIAVPAQATDTVALAGYRDERDAGVRTEVL